MIENKFGPFDVDLFASRINKKLIDMFHGIKTVTLGVLMPFPFYGRICFLTSFLPIRGTFSKDTYLLSGRRPAPGRAAAAAHRARGVPSHVGGRIQDRSG